MCNTDWFIIIYFLFAKPISITYATIIRAGGERSRTSSTLVFIDWMCRPDHVVEADSINNFKSRLDKYWTNQDVIYNYDCDLTGTGGGLPVSM